MADRPGDLVHLAVAGRDAPELFCLITDLLDHAAYPARLLAQAYHWRWTGFRTCGKPRPAPLSARRAAPGHPHRASRDQRLQAPDRLTP